MEELDLKELFKMFWDKKIQILVIVFTFMVIGVIYSLFFVTPMYEAVTTLLLVKVDETASAEQSVQQPTESITATDLTINSKLVSTYSTLISSNSVIRQVISELGIEGLDENDVRRHISVSSVEDTEVIRIKVTNANAVNAAKIANATANVFKQRVAEYYKINNVYVVDEAEVADGPSNVNHVKDVIIFALIGIVLAVAYVIIQNMLDTTVKATEDIEKNAELPVLASIPLYDIENGKGGKK